MKKKIALLTVLLVFFTSCEIINDYLGIDNNGKQVNPKPPAMYVEKVLEAAGPVGLAVSTLLGMGGAAYVGNRKGKKPLEALVGGIQKVRNDLTDTQEKDLVKLLAKHTPNKYHKAIRKIKDTL